MLCECRTFRIRPPNSAVCSQLNPVIAGHSDKSLSDGTVGPARNNDVVSNNTGGWLHRGQRFEDTGLAEQFRKVGREIFHVVGKQLVDLSGEVIIEHKQFASRSFKEIRDSQVSIDQRTADKRSVGHSTNRPDRSRDVVTVDEFSVQRREFSTAINRTADDRVCFRMMMVSNRWCDRGRSRGDFCPQPRAAFHNRPAAIGSVADQINHLPRFPAVVRHKNFVRLRIDPELPRIAETVAENLWPRSGVIDKRVVRRDRIVLSRGQMINIKSQDCAEQIGHILARR